LQGVRIDTLPTNGTLTLDGAPVSAGVTIPAGQISDLVFTPAADEHGLDYDRFDFSVGDAAGGFDISPNTFRFDVAPVSDTAIVTVADVLAEPGERKPLPLSLELVDQDGSETFAPIVVIENIPPQVQLYVGTSGVPVNVIDGRAELSPQDIVDLQIVASADVTAELMITGSTIDAGGAPEPFAATITGKFESRGGGLLSEPLSSRVGSTSAGGSLAGSAGSQSALSSGVSAQEQRVGFEDTLRNSSSDNDAFRQAAGVKIYLTGEVDDKLMIVEKGNVIKLSKGLFQHSDPNETLSLTVELANGGVIPEWMTLNSDELLFSGEPPLDAPASMEFVIIVKDSQGNEVKTDFKIIIVRDATEADRQISGENDQNGSDGDSPPPDLPVPIEGIDGAQVTVPSTDAVRAAINAADWQFGQWDNDLGERIEFADQLASHSRSAHLQQQAVFLDTLLATVAD
ncbi:Ig domain-containing protein, partial [Actibacterium sp. 188UL27-1]|uniref:Ig domain-containing protein n=1 Tax=Actibacterium sp. 188UL27-1 TaxID=2786961 RepID=UPI001958DC6B